VVVVVVVVSIARVFSTAYGSRRLGVSELHTRAGGPAPRFGSAEARRGCPGRHVRMSPGRGEKTRWADRDGRHLCDIRGPSRLVRQRTSRRRRMRLPAWGPVRRGANQNGCPAAWGSYRTWSPAPAGGTLRAPAGVRQVRSRPKETPADAGLGKIVT